MNRLYAILSKLTHPNVMLVVMLVRIVLDGPPVDA